MLVRWCAGAVRCWIAVLEERSTVQVRCGAVRCGAVLDGAMPAAMLDGPIAEIEIRRHPDSGPRSNEPRTRGRTHRQEDPSHHRRKHMFGEWLGRSPCHRSAVAARTARRR